MIRSKFLQQTVKKILALYGRAKPVNACGKQCEEIIRAGFHLAAKAGSKRLAHDRSLFARDLLKIIVLVCFDVPGK